MSTHKFIKLRAENAALKAKVYELKQRICKMDCRYTMGEVADISGSHCNEPCDRCQARRENEALEENLAALISAVENYQSRYHVEGKRTFDILKEALAAAKETPC